MASRIAKKTGSVSKKKPLGKEKPQLSHIMQELQLAFDNLEIKPAPKESPAAPKTLSKERQDLFIYLSEKIEELSEK